MSDHIDQTLSEIKARLDRLVDEKYFTQVMKDVERRIGNIEDAQKTVMKDVERRIGNIEDAQKTVWRLIVGSLIGVVTQAIIIVVSRGGVG